MNQANDGKRNLLIAADSEQPSKGSIDDPKLTLLAEELIVGKEACRNRSCACQQANAHARGRR